MNLRSLIILIFIFSGVSFSTSANAQAYQNITVKDVTKMKESSDIVVLDVRTPGEIQSGKIEGAVEINLYDPQFDQKISSLDKSKSYVVYCRSGRRSITACNKMSAVGFSKLYNVVGGYNAWKMKN